MRQIEIGDNVICVNNISDHIGGIETQLTIGKKYKVVEFIRDFHMKVINDNGKTFGYFPYRFILTCKLNNNVKVL
jgi:hypothetical protein